MVTVPPEGGGLMVPSPQVHVLRAASVIVANERARVEVERGALFVHVRMGQSEGYFVDGRGRLLVDRIVETELGAMGAPEKRRIDGPFIFFGLSSHLDIGPATQEDIMARQYTGCDELFGVGGRMCKAFWNCAGRQGPGRDGSLLAFPRGDAFDVLVVKGASTVYRDGKGSFVCNDQGIVIANSSGEIVVNKGGRTVVVRNGEVALTSGRD